MFSSNVGVTVSLMIATEWAIVVIGVIPSFKFGEIGHHEIVPDVYCVPVYIPLSYSWLFV
jgi:hypothetical protein